MELRGQQPQALEAIRRWYEKPTPVFRLDGSAGVGKTTVAIKFSEFARCHYMTLSGMAAQVLQRKGCHGASTIHSAIYRFDERSQSWVVNRESFVADYDVLVVDESMFVYPQLGRDILSFGIPVIAMGDPNQLPPPNGEGSFFESFQQDYVMTEVLRQAEDSPILELAYQILRGESLKPGKYGDSVVYGDKVKPSVVTDAMLAADQVLCGKNATRRGVNREIREKLGLRGEQGKELPVVGDRLICLRNNHQKGILNGEQFLVREIHNKELGEVVYMVVESVYNPGKLVDVAVPWDFFLGTEDNMDFFTKKSYDQFTYGYCVTVHRSQGSQWDNVVILDESKAFREAKKNHLYTAITRAAKSVKVFL